MISFLVIADYGCKILSRDRGASHFCQSTKLGFLRENSRLKLGVTADFITQSFLWSGVLLGNPFAMALIT